MFSVCACVWSSLVSLLRRGGSERLSRGWLLLSPRRGMALMFLLGCGPARPGEAGWHERRPLMFCGSEMWRSLLLLLCYPASLGLFAAVSSAHRLRSTCFPWSGACLSLTGLARGLSSNVSYVRMCRSSRPLQISLTCALCLYCRKHKGR
jgi:hypothetical protein